MTTTFPDLQLFHDPATAPPIWQKAVARTLAGEADARVLCVGDSTTAGVGSGSTVAKQGNPESFPYKMASLIGGAGYYYASAYGLPTAPGLGVPPSSLVAGAQDDRWSAGAGWALANYGWGGGSCWFAQTGIVTPLVYNPAGYAADATTFDSFDIYYIANSTGPGTFNAQATGGSVVPVNAATGSGDILKVTVAAGSAASTNTLTVTPVSGQVYIVGIEPFNSAVKRVRVANAGVPSSRTSHWISNNPGFGAIPAIKRYAPDLTIISLGINDALASVTTTTYEANLAQIITAAAVSGDVLLVSPIPSKSTASVATIKFERAYGAVMLSTGKPFLDHRDAIGAPGTAPGALMYDDLHPNAAGYARIAARVLRGVIRV